MLAVRVAFAALLLLLPVVTPLIAFGLPAPRLHLLRSQAALDGALEAHHGAMVESASEHTGSVGYGNTEEEVAAFEDALVGEFYSPQFQAAQVAGAAVLTTQQRNALHGIVAPVVMMASGKAGPPPPAGGGGFGGFGGGGFDGGFGGGSSAFVHLEVEAEAQTGAYPGFNVGPTLQPSRAACRGGGGDPAAAPGPPATATIGPFTYQLDAGGRPTLIYGNILIALGARPAISAAAVQYCDVLFDPNNAAGPFTARALAPGGGRNLWQSGHIIGFRIGGTNADPLNFYPQIRTSNNQGGRWGRIEAIALRVKGACPAAGVEVNVHFNNWVNLGVLQQVMPSAGTYTIIATPACYAALGCVMGGGGFPLPAGGVGAHAYLRAFCRHANQVGVVPNWKLQTVFSNDAADQANPAVRAADANLFP